MILYRRHYTACNNVLGGWMSSSRNNLLDGYSFIPDFTNYCFYDLDGRVIVNKRFDVIGDAGIVHNRILYMPRYGGDIQITYNDIDTFIQQCNLQIHTKTLNIIRKFELLSRL